MKLYRHRGAVYREAADRDRDAVPVPESYQDLRFYHGTPNSEAGEKILQDGELRPGTSDLSSMAPVSGRVYLTPSLAYVIPYVCGGVCDSNTVKSLVERGGQRGYLFVIQSDALHDLLPDEDVLGQLICADHWLRETFERQIRDHYPDYEQMADDARYEAMVGYEEDDPDFNYEEFALEYNFQENLYDCKFPEVALAGKFLLKHMDDEELVELLEDLEGDRSSALSHDEPVRWSEAWRFDKRLAPKLKSDGSNFFQLAERVA